MLPEELFTQPPREAPFDPKSTFAAPPLLRACCVCGYVLDQARSTLGLERWMSQEDYCLAQGVSPSELAFTHAYCPTCSARVQKGGAHFFQEPELER